MGPETRGMLLEDLESPNSGAICVWERLPGCWTGTDRPPFL
jgi:hypothetical protein